MGRGFSVGYLKCEKCGGYYELQKGESPDDFQDKCECGGNLNYVESFDMNKPDETPKNASNDKDNLQDKKGPKPKRQKYLIIGLVAVVFIIAIIGAYYAYGQYQDNKYYENYRLQFFNSYQAGEKFNSSLNRVSGYDTMTIDQFNQQSADIAGKVDQSSKDIDDAISYTEKSRIFQENMLKNANTDYQKKYAESLLNQTNARIKLYNLKKQIISLNKDEIEAIKSNDFNKLTDLGNQIKDLAKQMDPILNDIDKIIREREDIRANNPDFTARLNKEAAVSTNSTIK